MALQVTDAATTSQKRIGKHGCQSEPNSKLNSELPELQQDPARSKDPRLLETLHEKSEEPTVHLDSAANVDL